MKNLSWFNKLMFFLNIVLAVFTFVAYGLPFLAPKTFPFLSVLTLVMPLFFVLNGLFFVYWALQFKKRMILSGLVLLMGITFITKYYKFSGLNLPEASNDFTVMSYNVRLFNVFRWLERDDVPDNILSFIRDKNPDILCIQEFSNSANIDLKLYPHRYIFTDGKQIRTSQAIFSKFPIINEGSIAFPHSGNNVTFADVKKGKDIIRVYNIHLQSIKISPDVTKIDEDIEAINQEGKTRKMLKMMSTAFSLQQQQAEIIKAHRQDCPYPVIICVDMNNSAFSYVYRNLKENLKDSFEEAGKGFGASYKFRYYPARIDYIFVDESIQVKQFESFPDFENSDHYPILTRLSME